MALLANVVYHEGEAKACRGIHCKNEGDDVTRLHINMWRCFTSFYNCLDGVLLNSVGDKWEMGFELQSLFQFQMNIVSKMSSRCFWNYMNGRRANFFSLIFAVSVFQRFVLVVDC